MLDEKVLQNHPTHSFVTKEILKSLLKIYRQGLNFKAIPGIVVRLFQKKKFEVMSSNHMMAYMCLMIKAQIPTHSQLVNKNILYYFLN